MDWIQRLLRLVLGDVVVSALNVSAVAVAVENVAANAVALCARAWELCIVLYTMQMLRVLLIGNGAL